MSSRILAIALTSSAILAGPVYADDDEFDDWMLGVYPIGHLALAPAANDQTRIAKLAAYDPPSAKLLVIDGLNGLVRVDLSDPELPQEVGTPTDIGAAIFDDTGRPAGDANAIGISNGLAAIAVSAEPATDNGFVAFYQADGSYLLSCEVGPAPTMLTFSEDGTRLVVANEGTPDQAEDPEGSVSVIDVDAVILDGTCAAAVETAGFERFNKSRKALKKEGVRLFPGTKVANDLEPEHVAVSKNGKTAWVTLQEANAMARVDLRKAKVRDIIPLGVKDHSKPGNGIDASNTDKKARIRKWPVSGMYMPDAVSTFKMSGSDFKAYRKKHAPKGVRTRGKLGKTFLITANEGSNRGESTPAAKVTLDKKAYPDRKELQGRNALGGLKVSTIDGDTDGDGDIDQLHAYGARSFSIWNGYGELVFDSGDFLAREIADEFPDMFKGTDPSGEYDSSDSGAEPDSVVIAEIHGRTYAFIGLEGVGGVMVFDITEAWDPEFVQFVWSGVDITPEDLLVIGADDSPIDDPLLVVTHADSNLILVYQIGLFTEDDEFLFEDFDFETIDFEDFEFEDDDEDDEDEDEDEDDEEEDDDEDEDEKI